MPAFQAGYVGSIPITCSILFILLFWPIAFIAIPIAYLNHLEYEQNHDNEI